MATDFNSNVDEIIQHESKLTCASGKVANFSYTDLAYQCDYAAGTESYNYSQEQNIPLGTASALNTDTSILNKGVRSQASSITRMMLNHFFGRVSYNVNKLADYMASILSIFKTFLKEGDNNWSSTQIYTVGDLVYFVSTLNGKPCKRVFICIQESTNLPPVDSATGEVINATYWTEVSANFADVTAKNISVDGGIRATGQVISDNDMVVHGDLYVDGNITATTENQVATTGDFVVTRQNNNTPMSAGDYSGIAVNNYATGKIATLTADCNGEWRVSDSATSSSVTYTDISSYKGTFYKELTDTEAQNYPSHVMTNVNLLELDGVVWYNGAYYDKVGSDWYGTISVVNGAFDVGNLVTDTAVITALEELTPSSLVYFISVTDNVIDTSTNQPLLTREECSCLQESDLLIWDSTNKRAVHAPRPSCDGSVLQANINSNTGTVTLSWATSLPLTVTNATCFDGCTYACAKADMQSGLANCVSVNGVVGAPDASGTVTLTNVPPYFAKNTLYLVGDDVYIGDVNCAGMLGVKSCNTVCAGFSLRSCSGEEIGALYANSTCRCLCWTGYCFTTCAIKATNSVRASRFISNAANHNIIISGCDATGSVAGYRTIAIGDLSCSISCSVAIGFNTKACCTGSVGVGTEVISAGNCGVAIGFAARSTNYGSVAIGSHAQAVTCCNVYGQFVVNAGAYKEFVMCWDNSTQSCDIYKGIFEIMDLSTGAFIAYPSNDLGSTKNLGSTNIQVQCALCGNWACGACVYPFGMMDDSKIVVYVNYNNAGGFRSELVYCCTDTSVCCAGFAMFRVVRVTY